MHVFIFFFFFGNYLFTIIFHVSHLLQKFHNSPLKFSLIAISLYKTEKHTEISFASLCYIISHDFHYYYFFLLSRYGARGGGATLVEPLSAREIARHCRIELRAATKSFRNLFLTYWERREMKTDDDDGAEVCFGSGGGWGQRQIAVAALLWLLPLLSLPLDGEHARALVTLCPAGRTLARSLRRVARCTVGRGGDGFQLFTVFCFGFLPPQRVSSVCKLTWRSSARCQFY